MGTRVLDDRWFHSIDIELQGVHAPERSNFSICRIPNRLREVNNDVYSPRVVAIGPAYHGKDELRSMEKQKLQYTQSLLVRAVRNREVTLGNCAESILELGPRIRCFYEESLVESLEEAELCKIMLIDGCFMLELFLRYASGGKEFQNDPIFTTSWMIHSLLRDLVLLENQIPFIVLDRLYQILQPSIPDFSRPLYELALNFFTLPLNLRISTEHNEINSAHLLDFIHRCYAPASVREHSRVSMRASGPIESATFLAMAGIRFRSADTWKGLLDLEFSRGVLKVPQFDINDLTAALFTNLVAFEQLCRGDGVQYISSYIFLMDLLLNTAADVELLEHMRIVKNNLGSHRDLAMFLKDVSKHIFIREFYFEEICSKVTAYYNRPWMKYRALMLEHYFKSPWTSVGVLAGTLLLVLTVLQTFFTILSYNAIRKNVSG